MRAGLRWILAMGAAVAAVVLMGCGDGAAGSAAQEEGAGETPEGPRVVATIGMVADVARNVGGDRVEVQGLIPAGVDPHLYSATRSDVQRLMGADLILYNGLRLEGKLGDSFTRAEASGKTVVAVAGSVEEAALLATDEEGEQGFDPHLWMDPRLWMRAVDVVRDALIEVDPAGEATYRANAEAYRSDLESLDAYAVEVLASVPERQRVLVTAHDAFNYFGERFGFEVVGIQGISTESEAGVRDIERLVELLVSREVGAVFVESTVSDQNIKALISGAGARGHEVVIGGELFSDAMGEAGSYEGTYVGMIDHNVTTIARALGGEAPEGGMHGKLSR